MEINQMNAIGRYHGYWEKYRDRDKKELHYKCHCFNGKLIGYDECYNSFLNNSFRSKTHWNGHDRIGCEQQFNSQYFYKTSGKKFGEQIRWK